MSQTAARRCDPYLISFGCCDSRVSPEVIFDARPGELFVVRNVANLVPPYSPDGTYHGVSAALEFGVGALRVKHVPKTEVSEFPGKIRTPRTPGFEREAKIHGVDLQLVDLLTRHELSLMFASIEGPPDAPDRRLRH
jgi:hypothetical protein